MKFLIQKRAYFIRLLVTIVCIFTGMAVLCTIFLSLMDYQQVSTERAVLNNSRISFFRQTVDTQLNTALSQIEILRNDTSFAQFAISGKQEDARALGIYDKLQENQFLFDNLEISIGVLHPKTGLLIMSDIYNQPNLAQLTIDYDALSLNRLTMLNTNGVIPLEHDKTRDGAIFMIRQRYLASHDLIFLFMNYSINNLTVEETDNFALVYNDEIAYTSSVEAPPEGLLELDGSTKRLGEYEVYIEESQVFPAIRYIYYTKPAGGVSVLKIAAVFLTYMLVGVLLAFMLVRKLYKPIGTVVDSIEKTEADGHRHYDEMQYISDSVHQMKEDIQRLKQSDMDYRALICNEFLYNLLNGVLVEQEIEEKLENLDLRQLRKKNRLICVEIIGFGSQYQGMDNSMYKLIRHDLEEIFLERIFDQKFSGGGTKGSAYAVQMSAGRIVFIVPDGDYKKNLEELCAEFELEYELDLIVTISKAIEDAHQFETAYHDAVYTIENGFFNIDTYVVDAEAAKDTAGSDIYYPMEIEQKIIENMLMGEVENAIGLVSKILDANIEKGLVSREWTQFKFLLVSTINRILSQMNRTVDEVFGEETVLYLELSGKSKSVRKYKVLALFETLGACIKNETVEKNSQFDKMTAFIDQNLDKDVSLIELAEYMGLSSSYVSKLFKMLAKENFKTYVNKRRLEMAKNILKTEKNIKIAEVAARIGCNNTVTFTRMFKKYTGMTPSEFQK